MEQMEFIRQTVEGTVGKRFPFDIDACDGAGLTVEWNGGTASIAAEDKTALARGVFLLIQAVADGKTELHIRETRHIASCGAFIDCSRGAVMTVAACKKYIAAMAAIGMNLFVMYMEDTYTVPEYPYFGHLRGRYTAEELKELDDYAASLGVELLPQIQTLAHLGQFLQWKAVDRLQDTKDCLMADEEETYRFIEAEIKAIRECFRTNRLHIGMDEAHNMGLIRYLRKYGVVDRYELLKRHLKRVVEICDKYHFHAMMWSDMFFRLGSAQNEYYDLESHLPDSVIAGLPNVDMVYWDYYHMEDRWYEHMLS